MLPLTELGQGRQGQLNEMGGSEMGNQPPCQDGELRTTTPTQNAPTYQEIPTPTMRDGFTFFKAAKQT